MPVDRLYDGFNVLIIGADQVAERHALAQKILGAKVMFYDTIPGKARSKASKLKVGYAESIDSPLQQANLVYICTPANAHTSPARLAIEAGKAIFCEKPLTTNLEEAYQLAALVDQHKTPFIVGNYVRFEQGFRVAREIGQGRRFGLKQITASYFQDIDGAIKKTPWRKDTPLLYDGGVHPIDLACWIANEPVESISATTGPKKDHKYPHPEDYYLTLHFKSNLEARIWINAKAKPEEAGIGLVLTSEREQVLAHHKWNFVRLIFFEPDFGGRDIDALSAVRPVDRAAQIVNSYLTGRSKNHTLLPDIHEAMQVMRILDAAQRSIDKEETILL